MKKRIQQLLSWRLPIIFVIIIGSQAEAQNVCANVNTFCGIRGTSGGSGDLLSTNNLSDVASAVTSRANLGLAIGTNVQAYNANLASIASLTYAANKCTYWTGPATGTLMDCTAAGRSMIGAVDAAAQTALLSAVVGDSGAGGTKGLVPAPSAGDAAASKYLKADGTWAIPAGGITIGTTTITGGTSTRVLRNSSGVVQEDANLTNTGSAVTIGTGITGTNVALTVNNGTSTGAVQCWQDNGVAIGCVNDGGTLTMATSTNFTSPKYSFTGATTSGFGYNSNNANTYYTSGGSALLEIGGNAGGFGINIYGTINGYNFGSSAGLATDGGIRRISAGLLAVNDGSQTNTAYRDLKVRKLAVGGTAPALTSCGTSPTITGADGAFILVTGTGATACTVTFNTAFSNAAVCVISARSGTDPVYSTSTTALTLSTAVASTTYDVICMDK